MSQNLAVLGAYSDAMARGDREAVFEYWSPDFVSHVTARVNPAAVGTDVRGHELEWWTQAREAFPDMVFSVDLLIESGDLIVSNWTVRGTHTGTAFYDVEPSGEPVVINGTAILRMRDGKIVEHRAVPTVRTASASPTERGRAEDLLRRADRGAVRRTFGGHVRAGGRRPGGELPRRSGGERRRPRARHRYRSHRVAAQPAGRSRARDRPVAGDGRAAAGEAGRGRHRRDDRRLRDHQGGRDVHARLPRVQHDHEPDHAGRTGRVLPQRRRASGTRRVLRDRGRRSRSSSGSRPARPSARSP